MNRALRTAIMLGSLVGAVGIAAAPANAVTPASCTYQVTGSPGSESFTAHVTNTCDKGQTRAIITYVNFYGTYKTATGGWVVNGSSKASTSSNITDTLVCWGYQYNYQAHLYTTWLSSGCP